MSDTTQLVWGGSLMLFVASGATKMPLAYSETAKLGITLGTKDATTKDSGIFVEKYPGLFDWNMSSDGLVSYTLSGNTNTIDDIYSLMLSRTPVNVGFAVTTGTSPAFTIDASKKNFTGTGIIVSMDISASKDDIAKYSIKIDGTGALTMA